MVADSVIVILANKTITDDDEGVSVWRYWQNNDPEEQWLESEYLFSTKVDGNVLDDYYEDVDIFDDYAIGFKKNTFYVIFWKEYAGEVVPENYEMKAYEQEKESSIAGYTFYDRSGYKGDWELIIFVQYTGAIQIVPVATIISPSSYNVRFSPDLQY